MNSAGGGYGAGLPSYCMAHTGTIPGHLLYANFESVSIAPIQIIKNSPTVKTLDITGGAPELNDHFRYMVEEGRALGLDVIDR